MDFNVEARRLQLENLKQFILSSKNKVQNVLSTIGWNAKEVLQDNQLITCSLDTNHKVPPKSVEKHIKKCVLRKEGYDLNEQFLSEPQNGIHTIHIDDHKKIEILSASHKLIENFRSGWNGQDPDPKTSDRLTSTFSTDERLALYDYATANTVGPPKLPEFDIVNLKRNDNKPLTYEEKRALERDMKRRKIKYKSVHTNHKNPKEVLREVIESQMLLYRDWLNANENPDFLNNLSNASEKDCETDKIELENNRSRAVSRNSNISSSSHSTRRRYDERKYEETIDSQSTSRRTSIDRDSVKSNSESMQRKRRRSRSPDNHRRNREEHSEKYLEKSDYRRCKEYSPSDRYKRDKYRRRSPISSRRRRSPIERRSSRERKHNGYKEYRR